MVKFKVMENHLQDYTYPFVNDFIQSQIESYGFSPEVNKIFDDVIPISTLVGGQVLKSISNNPIKMFLLLCPNFNPPLDEIAKRIKIVNRTREEVTQLHIDNLRQMFTDFLTNDEYILNDRSIIEQMSEIEPEFTTKYDTHDKIVRPVFRYITGSEKYPRNLEIEIINGDKFKSHTCFNRLDVPFSFLGNISDTKVDFFTRLLKSSIFDTGFGVAGIKVFKKKQ